MSAVSPPLSILAIETATHACSVALWFEASLIKRYSLEPRGHTRLLLPMIQEVLKEAAIPLSEVQVFAYGCGPGSFTGVRIATAVIQGLGFARRKPIIPVSSLRVLAQQKAPYPRREEGSSASPTYICATLDARMQETYWGLFKTNSKGIVEPIGSERLSTPQDITLASDINWVRAEGYPRAEEVAVIAAFEHSQGFGIAAEQALPVYLRNQII